jgi:anaerobic selenocysteine-containing dehydrogenase
MQDTHHYRICPLCEACCGLSVTVRGEQVVAVRGYEADVLSQGYICPKGVALKDLHEDPDRLRQPLIKRNGVFEKATWEEAYAEVARRLLPLQQAHGKNAVGLVAGNPSSHKMGLMLYLPRLLKALATQQFFSAATLDQIPRHVSSGLLFGHWMTVPIPDIARSQWLMVIGANPLASNGSMWTVPDFKGKAKAMQARGGRLIVIDPRRTETAAMADEHHFIRPRGDVYLLLGMLHTVLGQGWDKLGAAHDWVQGLDALREAVKPFSPERMQDHCGIDAATIHRLAYELAHTPKAAIYGRIGTCTQEFGTTNTWLMDVLNIVTGHLDEEGGTLFAKAAAFAANTSGRPGVGRGVPTSRFSSRVSQAPEVMGEVPIGCLAEEIETPGAGQLKALFTIATNPVLSAPNGERLAKALSSLELMVSLDIYLNETTRHADVILPGPSPLEDMHYDVPYPQMAWRNQARFSGPVLQRPAGMPTEWQSLLRLSAIAQGMDAALDVDAFDDQLFANDIAKLPLEAQQIAQTAAAGLRGPERLLAVALKAGPYALDLQAVKNAPGGVDLGPLTPRLPEVLRTPTGMIDLVPQALVADLTRVQQALAQPPGGTGQMLLIGRRDVRSNNSWMHNLPLLAKGPMRCTALMHPKDGQRLGLFDGGQVVLKNAGQSLQAEVQLTDTVMPGVVSLPHGWGHDLAGVQLGLAGQRPGVNINALLSEDWRDPLSGNAVLSGVPVEVVGVGHAQGYDQLTGESDKDRLLTQWAHSVETEPDFEDVRAVSDNVNAVAGDSVH